MHPGNAGGNRLLRLGEGPFPFIFPLLLEIQVIQDNPHLRLDSVENRPVVRLEAGIVILRAVPGTDSHEISGRHLRIIGEILAGRYSGRIENVFLAPGLQGRLLRQFPQSFVILNGRIAQDVIQLILRPVSLADMVNDGPGAFLQQFAGFRRYGTDEGPQLRLVRNDVGSLAGLEFPTVITGMEPWEPFP